MGKSHPSYLLLLLAISSCFIPLFQCDHIDIHVLLSKDALSLVGFVSDRVTDIDPHNDIDFHGVSTPHITLYLTDFQDGTIQNVSNAVADVQGHLPQCPVHLIATNNSFDVGGQYAMWEVELNDCLQLLSDTVVNATAMYAKKNQSIPGWVNDLPEPEREKKIKYVKEYGSPNVFDSFQPHVTLAWDPSPARLKDAFSRISAVNFPFTATKGAGSTAGPHGTVNTNGTLFFIFSAAFWPAIDRGDCWYPFYIGGSSWNYWVVSVYVQKEAEVGKNGGSRRIHRG